MISEKAKTHKRSLSVASSVLSLTMFVGAFGTSALAASDVAQVGKSSFGSLSDAIAAAKAGDTVQLIADSSAAGAVTIDKDITIDLNGYTFTDTSADYALAVSNKATVTIKDSSEEEKGYFISESAAGLYAFEGNLVIDSGTIESGTKAISVKEGTVTLNGGLVECSNIEGYAVYAFEGDAATIKVAGGSVDSAGYGIGIGDNAATVEISDGSISAVNFALATNGSSEKDAKVTISGGHIASGTIGVYQPSGEFTLTGGTISGATAYYIKSGTLNISGGKLSANGEKTDRVVNNNGADATGDALVIDNCGYPKGEPKVNIAGGEFDSDKATAVGKYASEGLEAIKGFISGGKFSNAVAEEDCAEGCTPFKYSDAQFGVRNGNLTFADFVERLYTVALGRPSEEEGKNFWIENVTNGKYTGSDCGIFFLTSDEFKNKTTTDDQFITTLYKTFFDREADSEGLAFWENFLKNGGSREDVVRRFADSNEWCNVCASYNVKSGALTAKASIPSSKAIDFATRLYTECLGREPEEEGLQYWALALTNLEVTGYQAAAGFFASPEYQNKKASNEAYVNALYKTFMGREADEDGLKFWIGQLNANVGRFEVLAGFAMSDEFTNICASYGINRGDL